MLKGKYYQGIAIIKDDHVPLYIKFYGPDQRDLYIQDLLKITEENIVFNDWLDKPQEKSLVQKTASDELANFCENLL